jgi:alanyl-tRNA synthetase
VHQKGSNITPDRLRFDFNADGKVQRELLDKVEEYVNEAIADETQVTVTSMPKQQAMDEGVEGSFWEKYPDEVKVYSMVGKSGKVYSRELCGGPHVENTKDMGKFKIKKEEASSAGVRRIKAVLIND